MNKKTNPSRCRTCDAIVAKQVKTCLSCGESNPSLSKFQNDTLIPIIATLIISFISYQAYNSSLFEPWKPAAFDITAQGIKTLDKSIDSVEINKNKIELELIKEPFAGGQSDWNSVAIDTHSISKNLLSKPEISVIKYAIWSPNNKTIWANVVVDRAKLPDSYLDLTYLQFFGLTKHGSGSLQVNQWLCEFYKNYQSIGLNCPD